MKTIKEEFRGQFWEDIRRSSKERCDRKISNRNDVISTVSEIYYGNPIYPRFGLRSMRKKVNEKHRAEINHLLTDIGDRIHDYFVLEPNSINDQINFDAFHDELCDLFLKGINKIRKNARSFELSYGQAQKLINLTFKYLTTYSDYETYADLFRFSHMTIDGTVLRTLRSKQKLLQYLGVDSVRVNFVIEHGWTSMTKEQYHDLLIEYRRAIDPYLGDKSYMHLEYCIWNTKRHLLIDLQNSGGVDATPISEFYK